MDKRHVGGLALIATVALAAGLAMGQDQALEGADSKALATHLVAQASTPRGLCAVVGCKDPDFTLAVVRSSHYLVHVLCPDKSDAVRIREKVDVDGLYVRRVVAEAGSSAHLPYADNLIDLVVVTDLRTSALNQVSLPEILRVVRPEGKAILGHRKGLEDGLPARELKQWLHDSGCETAKIDESHLGTWAVLTKPRPAGEDNWSHWEHGPDNNPLSTDQVIKAPYMSQWLGEPYYIAMPAITTVAGGRTFLAMGHIAHHEREEPWLNTLVARNLYNGAELWQRKLPDGYLVHRSAFIATDDTFYMIDLDGNGCLLLDPETGDERREIRIPEATGEWKWMAMEDGVLYVLAGGETNPAETTVVRSPYSHWSWGELSKGYYAKRVPWGFGTTIVAYDLGKERTTWSRSEDAPIDSRAMAIGGGRVFFYCPDARLGALDAKTGEPRWTNEHPEVRDLIEQPGRGLGSTPGFRTACMCVYTPEALCFQGQTLENLVAVSPKDGHFMWHRTKSTNNPNVLYADGRLVVGIGPGGSTVVLDPLTGETIEDLQFGKRSCARLTGTPDSFFCRGMPDGITRYDRLNHRVIFNGAVRPACNDGIIGTGGLLYVAPWLCDCNLSLMGTVTMCSAGDFTFGQPPVEAERLEFGDGDVSQVAPFEETPEDWATYRGSQARGACTNVAMGGSACQVWAFHPESPCVPTAATSAGSCVFLCGDDGKVRALDSATGALKWCHQTAGPILQPPTISEGRAYVGSGDGYVYALEAATGQLLWRFRAAPVERRIMMYGALSSTWPVNTGVLVQDGVAYAAAGLIDYDGTYVYALDARRGGIQWANTTSGHLDEAIRKGVSAQGNLCAAAGRLWMPGGNVISPAIYDLQSGQYVGDSPGNGSPRANRGEEIGIFRSRYVIFGGRLRYSARENVVNPGGFQIGVIEAKGMARTLPLCSGKIPPAWDDERVVLVDGRFTQPSLFRGDDVEEYLKRGDPKRPPAPVWTASLPKGADVVALALTRDAVLATVMTPGARSLAPRWSLCALNPEDGSLMWEQSLPGAALATGLLVDQDGRAVVVLQDGSVACFGGGAVLGAEIEHLAKVAEQGGAARDQAVATLLNLLNVIHGSDSRSIVLDRLATLGVDVGREARKTGCITEWRLLGPVPWDLPDNPIDKALIHEPNVDGATPCQVGSKKLRWKEYVTQHPDGMVDLVPIFGPQENVAIYAYAEAELPEAQDLLLKIGSNDGFKCWLNGQEVGRFDGGRSYGPDQDTLPVRARKGKNVVLLKVTQMGDAWAFSARLTTPEGRPVDLNARTSSGPGTEV